MYKKKHLKKHLKKKTIQHHRKGHLGSILIKAIQPGYLTKNQIEASRKILSRTLKKVNGKSWVNVKKFIPLTQKSKGARMGKGKGTFFCDIAPIKKGSILFEMQGLTDSTLLTLLLGNLSSKLPIKIRLINPF